jgi:hypothetical protein
MKFRSCLTLFREAAHETADRELFGKALDQFYNGQPDTLTLELRRSRARFATRSEFLWYVNAHLGYIKPANLIGRLKSVVSKRHSK